MQVLALAATLAAFCGTPFLERAIAVLAVWWLLTAVNDTDNRRNLG